MGKNPDMLSDKDSHLNEELKSFRMMYRCSVCNKNLKDALISKCYHAFCRKCLEKNVESRVRKCPTCKARFGQEDI